MPYPDPVHGNDPVTVDQLNHAIEKVHLLHGPYLYDYAKRHNLPLPQLPATTLEYPMPPYIRPIIGAGTALIILIVLVLATSNQISTRFWNWWDTPTVASTTTPKSSGYVPKVYDASKAPQTVVDHPILPPVTGPVLPSLDTQTIVAEVRKVGTTLSGKIDGVPEKTGPVIKDALDTHESDQQDLMIDCVGAWKDIAAARTPEERESQIRHLSSQKNFPLCKKHWEAHGNWSDTGPVNMAYAPMPAPTIIDQRPIYMVPARRHGLPRGGLPEYRVLRENY